MYSRIFSLYDNYTQFYTEEQDRGDGPGECSIPYYIRGYVFQKSKWYSCFSAVDGDYYMDYKPFVWEKPKYAYPQYVDYGWEEKDWK